MMNSSQFIIHNSQFIMKYTDKKYLLQAAMCQQEDYLRSNMIYSRLKVTIILNYEF